MSVTLLRNYGGFLAGAVVRFPDATEAALIAQGLATTIGATDTIVPQTLTGAQFVSEGGNVALINAQGVGTPATPQGPTILPTISLGTAALTAVGTSSAQVAGTLNISEIYVPFYNTWKGAAVLNGTTASTDNMLVALYNSSGVLLTTSALAGTVAASASTFQNRDFLVPQTLIPGRYFLAVQSNGTTAHTNKLVAANGQNVMTTSVVGVFGTVPASITVPTTFTTAVGPIFELYTV